MVLHYATTARTPRKMQRTENTSTPLMSATLAALIFAALIAGATSCGDGESRVVSGTYGGSASYFRCCTPEVASSVSYSTEGGSYADLKVHPLAMSPFGLSMQASDPDLNGTFLPLKSNWVEVIVTKYEVRKVRCGATVPYRYA